MEKSRPSSSTIFPESRLAHELLDGLEGLEIGPASHNPFGLKTRNVGLTADRDPDDYEFFKQSQLERCGSFATIDISADAANIPVPNDSTDFVLHSHVWEHLQIHPSRSTSGSGLRDLAAISLSSCPSEMRRLRTKIAR